MSKSTGRREFIHAAGLTAAGLMAAARPTEGATPAGAVPQAPETPSRSMGARFRELLRRREPFEALAAYDAMTARMVEVMGFPSIFLGGSLVTDFYAEPVWMTTLTERLEYARRIADSVDIPILADIDQGGDPLVIYRITRQYERARVGAIHILDGVVGDLGVVTSVLPVNKMVDKIHAALDARTDMAVTVRCQAAVLESKDKAIERGVAYAQAGAESIWFTNIPFAELPRVADAIKIPVTGQMASDVRMADAKAAKVTVAVYASLLQFIAQAAVYDALNELKSTGLMVKASGGTRLGGRIPADVRAKLLRVTDATERAKKYNVGG